MPFTDLFRPRSRSRPADPMLRHKDLPDIPPSSYTKASVRSQTRPISSTTTATHSTITPLPSDSLKNRRHLYTFHHSNTFLPDPDHATNTPHDDDDDDDHHFPRSETPSSTRQKPLFHSFFGISFSRRSSSSASAPQQSSSSDRNASLTSSRKPSFRLSSRPTTPKSLNDASSKSTYSIPVPSSPLPLSASPRRRSFGLGSSQRSTPKSSTTHLPLPHAQSPSPRAHGRRHSVGSERPPHDSAVALSEEPPHRTLHKGTLPDTGRNKGKEREKPFTDSRGPLPDFRPSFDPPSKSLPIHPSPISHPVFSHLTTVDSASSAENNHPSLLTPHRLPVIPRIIHTPPTPQRPGEQVDSLSIHNTSSPDFSNGEITKPKAVTIAHREQVLVSNSHSHPDPPHATSSRRRFTPRFFGGKDVSKTKDSNGQKSTRRPPTGPSDASPHRTPVPNVTGPVRNMTSHRSKLGSFDFERPVSALNKSSSTVDRYPTDNSSYSKARLHAIERTISEDSTRGAKSSTAHHPGQGESPMWSQMKPVHTGGTSVLSFSSVSVQTASTGKGIGSNTPAGQSSSWGRTSGRRILHTSNGTFAFEHPSSVPSRPNPQNFNLPIMPNQNEGHMSGLAQSQPTVPLHTSFNTRNQRSDHVEQGYSKPGQRKPKGKGRSLDLGLGLSWAPSRLREEVLMPGLILTREKAKLEKTKANGSNVTTVFESILSEPRFEAFKEYVYRFDAHMIPLEGPSGLLARVEKLLADSGLSERERNRLITEFAVFVENHSG